MDARIDHLHSLRSYELELVINYLKRYFSDRKDIRILEIGAGTGWQAEQLSRLGYFVDAIDLPSSNYRDQRVFKVLDEYYRNQRRYRQKNSKSINTI